MVIMLRDEHCPPHAHVDAGTWSARFKFSFWHNSVELRTWFLILAGHLWRYWKGCVTRSDNLLICAALGVSGGTS